MYRWNQYVAVITSGDVLGKRIRTDSEDGNIENRKIAAQEAQKNCRVTIRDSQEEVCVFERRSKVS